jgi:hypothetical protein
VYRVKEDITDKREDNVWNSVEEFSNGRFDSTLRRKRNEWREEQNSPPPKLRKELEQSSSSINLEQDDDDSSFWKVHEE